MNFHPSISLFIYLVFCLLDGFSAQNPDVGAVYIGDPADAGIPSVSQYTFYNYDLSGKSLQLYGVVRSGTDPSANVSQTEDVTISCSLSPTGDGFSGVSLTSPQVILAVADTSVLMPLSLTTPGRAVEVTCSGNSTSAGQTCPAAGTGGPQFCPQTSQSNTVSVIILPVATVSLCEPQIFVNEVNTTQTVSVHLSESPLAPVDIQCSITSTLGLQITFSPLTIPAGDVTSGLMEYTVQLPSTVGAQATVTCSGQSSNGQFDSTTSSSAETTFSLRIYTLGFEPTFSEIYNTTFASLLTLSQPLEESQGNVVVGCRAQLVTSLVQAQAEVDNPDCNFNPATTDPTADWLVVNATLDILNQGSEGQNQYRVVVTERQKAPIDVRTEVVVTTCCVQTSSSNVQYAGEATVAVAVAKLSPFPCQTCNTSVDSPESERRVQNPGYVELSPCPCDLTDGTCDFNCCCDTDCDARQSAARFSSCVEGLAGGQDAPVEEYDCDSNAFDLPDYHVLTCVYWEENAYLGMFYKSQAKYTSYSQMSEAVSKDYKGRFSFKETERRYSTTTATGYVYGSRVTTRRADLNTNSLYGTGILALPRSDFGGPCNPLTPVHYLSDTSSQCSTRMVRDLCSSDTVFSGNVYAVSSLLSGCGQAFKVTATEYGEVAPADVRYYKATDLDWYVQTSSTPGSVPLGEASATQKSEFPTTLDGLLCEEGCTAPECWQYNTGRDASASTPPLPARMPWDTGFVSPPTPTIVGTTCENSVLEVRYNFEWSGASITKLTADVIMGDVPLDTDLIQRFSVEWSQPNYNASVTLSDNYLNTQDPYERSGPGGYEMGEPLSSGCQEVTSGQSPVDTRSEMQMAIWKTGVDGLCETATREPLTFGEDAMSSCALRLTFDDLNNTCEVLGDRIMNHLNVLFAANVIGRTGVNNPATAEDWIGVYRRNLSLPYNPTTPAPPTTTLPPGVNETEPEISLDRHISGICLLPSAVELVVLYAQAGASNYVPRLEVVGAYLNYTQSNWTMNCAGANSQRCVENSPYVQSFFLTSSVRFIKVPPSPDRRESFYTRLDLDNCDTDTCYRFEVDFSDNGICYYDSCWREIAYPVSTAYQGVENRYHTLAFFLVLVLGVVGYAAVSKPGWYM